MNRSKASPRRGRRAFGALRLSFTIMLAACEGSTSPGAPPQPSNETGGQLSRVPEPPHARGASAGDAAVYVATLAQEVAVPEALITGALRVRDNCLVLDSGGRVSLALVPAGTRLDDGRSEIAIGRAKLPLGREMRFGGGAYPPGHEVFGKLAAPVPSNCLRSGTLVGDAAR